MEKLYYAPQYVCWFSNPQLLQVYEPGLDTEGVLVSSGCYNKMKLLIVSSHFGEQTQEGNFLVFLF